MQNDDQSDSLPTVTENATDFTPATADLDPKIRDHYERLRMYNTGEYNGSWQNDSVASRRDRFLRFRAILSRFELSISTRTRAELIFDSLDTDINRAYPLDPLAAAVGLYAVNEINPNGAEWDPRWNPGQDCRLGTLMDEIPVERNDVKNAYKRLVKEFGAP